MSQCQTWIVPALKAIHFYRSYLSSCFQARCEMKLVCLSRYPYCSWFDAHWKACVTWLWCSRLSLFFFCNCEKHSRHKVGLGVAHFNESVHTVQVKVLWVTVLLIREDFLHGQENMRNGTFEFEMVILIVRLSQNFILLVTRGTEGQKIYHQNNKIYRIKPKEVSEWQSNFYRKKIYDTFG